jgi:hypothetical protein
LRLRQFVLHDVEQGLVVVRVDVGDRLARVRGIARRLPVVVDLRPRHEDAVAVDEPVVSQVAGQSHLDLVLVQQKPRQLRVRCAVHRVAVRVGEQAGPEALDPRVIVERTAATHGVP